MSQATPNLSLPLIQPNQAQKHVTHNEALQVLDALVQPRATDLDQTDPPTAPENGDCHIVAAPATGDWLGQDGNVAVFANGGWVFYAPRAGWRVYVDAQGGDAVFDGTTWQLDQGGTPSVLGVNTAADTTNRLAVSAPASLLTHEGAGHQLKINKSTNTDTNSLLFQTDWSGRAEMGCAGNDDFSIKVSDDGSTFHDGLIVDRTSGAVRFPNGLAGTGSAAGVMGGQVVGIVGERNSTLSVGQWFAFGNGATGAAGPVLPFAGRIIAATLSIAGGPSGITVVELMINKVAVQGRDISVDYASTNGLTTTVEDFAASPIAVQAGDAITLRCSSTVGAQRVVGAIYVVFD